MGSDDVAVGVIAAVVTLVGSAAAWVVVGDVVVEHASFAKELVVVFDNIDPNDGVGWWRRSWPGLTISHRHGSL